MLLKGGVLVEERWTRADEAGESRGGETLRVE